MTNIQYIQHAQTYAMQNPQDGHAQRPFAYWQEVVQRQAALQGAQGAPTAGPASQAAPMPPPMWQPQGAAPQQAPVSASVLGST